MSGTRRPPHRGAEKAKRAGKDVPRPVVEERQRARRSRQDPPSTARCRGGCPERADHHAGVAGGAPGRGLGDRRLAPLGAL